ncbi:MAG: tRNA1(Val) (adenine(37)-N6)-methyltransferase [Clostridia bacterium]|nr:tRNA1(Val) (adenine(37)-N6)-methyltransferase [Clostridia bacterium]
MIFENERIDDLHRNGYKIIQNTKGFCFGIDAVLLSGFAKVKKGEKALDLCTGTGIIPILLEAKTQGELFCAIEIQEAVADMAVRSVALNGLEDKIKIVAGDIKKCTEYFKIESFDVITCNPPYMTAGSGYMCESSPKAISRHEILCNIDDVFGAVFKMLKYGGRMYMVHRCERLADIFVSARKNGIEPKKMELVLPYEGKAPELVLIEFVKGGKAGLKVNAPLVIYNSDGSYTEKVYNIYYN